MLCTMWVILCLLGTILKIMIFAIFVIISIIDDETKILRIDKTYLLVVLLIATALFLPDTFLSE